MKALRLSINYQAGLGLIFGLITGLLLHSSSFIIVSSVPLLPTPSPTYLPTNTITPVSSATFMPIHTPTATSIPEYRNINQVHSLAVVLYRQKPPEIQQFTSLPEGRLVVTKSGNSKIEMMNSLGEVVYSQSFTPIFLSGEPMKVVEQRTMTFILPANLGGVKVRVITPQGDVEYEFPTGQ